VTGSTLRDEREGSYPLALPAHAASPADTSVRVVGIDDFALKRGECYGTILVNSETSKPLTLLPDRTAEAVLPWLKRHQEIEVVSRGKDERANHVWHPRTPRNGAFLRAAPPS
jgi:hypothetical protein